MSTLARFRKPGGFKQLLLLVEASGQAKREQMMKTVETEDQSWFAQLNKRMLTIDKILGWSPEHIEKILMMLPETTWLTALMHLSPEARDAKLKSIVQFQPVGRLRQLEHTLATLSPTPAQIDAAHILVIKKVREMQSAGHFRPETIDPFFAVDGLDKMLI